MKTQVLILRRFRPALGIFMALLFLSGVTAFPLQRELDWLCAALGYSTGLYWGLSGSGAEYLDLGRGFDFVRFGDCAGLDLRADSRHPVGMAVD